MSINLIRKLESFSGKKIKVKINDNHSTMLSVRWGADCTRVSLHRMFLQAPKNVMDELACYIKQGTKIIPAPVRFFIEDNMKNLDYSHSIKQELLCSQGTVYNLKKIYNALNQEYFDNKLNLSITWFGKHNKRGRSRITFGLYQDPLKLIKIHRVLDSPTIPEYLVQYVVYHEMVHHVCPSYRDENDIHRIHSKEFKRKEEQFSHYQLAQQWIKQNQQYLFKGC